MMTTLVLFLICLSLFIASTSQYVKYLAKLKVNNDTASRNFNLACVYGILCIIIAIAFVLSDNNLFFSINLNDVLNEGNSMHYDAFTTGYDKGPTEVVKAVKLKSFFATIPVTLVIKIRAHKLERFYMKSNPFPKRVLMSRSIRVNRLPNTEIHLS